MKLFHCLQQQASLKWPWFPYKWVIEAHPLSAFWKSPAFLFNRTTTLNVTSSSPRILSLSRFVLMNCIFTNAASREPREYLPKYYFHHMNIKISNSVQNKGRKLQPTNKVILIQLSKLQPVLLWTPINVPQVAFTEVKLEKLKSPTIIS